MAALRGLSMVDQTSLSAFVDREEVIGQQFMNECDSSVPVTFSEWTKLKIKGGGKPRGKSVNEGHKYDFLD